MLKKFSRIFCVTGSALALLVFFLYSFDYQFFLGESYYDSLNIAAIPILIAAAGIAGIFFIHKKPVLAGILMIVSGEFVLPFSLPYSYSLPVLTIILVILIPMLLSAAGVFAFISAYKTSGSEARLVLNKLSFTIGVTSATLYTFISLIISVFGPYELPQLLISAAGLLGSLLVRKKTVPGSVLMLLSGAFILTSRLGLLWPTTLLLIAAGVLGLTGAYKTSVEAMPVLMKLSIIAGITGAVLNIMPWLDFISYEIFNLTLYGNEGVHSIIWLYSPNFLASAASLSGSLLLRKKPLPGALLVLFSGASIIFFPHILGPYVTPSLLIASGALAVISCMKTSAREELQDNNQIQKEL